MNVKLRGLVAALELTLPVLGERRANDAFSNDIFEATDDLINLGQNILSGDSRVNYPARVQQERELWTKLRAQFVKTGSDAATVGCRLIFDVAEEILSIAEAVHVPSDGYHGFVAIAYSKFDFLRSLYDFKGVTEAPTIVRFASPDVYLLVKCSKNVSSSCVFGRNASGERTFWIDDLLFLYRDERYKTLPDQLALDNEVEIAQWLGFLANIFREYGDEVLRNRPGIFERLAKAQESRDREYIRELERH